MGRARSVATAVVAVLVGLAIGAIPAQSQPGNRTTITALDLNRDDRGFETDVNRSGFSKGDMFGFTSKLLDPDDRSDIGSLAATCTTITVARKSGNAVQHCVGTGSFEGGQLAVMGRLKFARDAQSQALVITGGTETYEGAAGTMTIEFSRNSATLTFDFTTN